MQGLPDPRCFGRPDRTPGKINNIVAGQTVRCRIPTRIYAVNAMALEVKALAKDRRITALFHEKRL